MGRTLVYRLQYTRWLVGFAVSQKATEPLETIESAEVERGGRWGEGGGVAERDEGEGGRGEAGGVGACT